MNNVFALRSVSFRLGYGHAKPDQDNAVIEFILGRNIMNTDLSEVSSP